VGRVRKKLPEFEMLVLGRNRHGELIFGIVSPRPHSQEEMSRIMSAFMAVADKVHCQRCGRPYSTDVEFVVIYRNKRGEFSELEAAACGRCVKEIRLLVREMERLYERH